MEHMLVSLLFGAEQADWWSGTCFVHRICSASELSKIRQEVSQRMQGVQESDEIGDESF